jgi:5-methylcytosine-specific restriction endonuclease McrA
VEPIAIRRCQNCGKTFRPDPRNIKKGRGIFCSRECFNEYYQKEKPVVTQCQYCGRIFIVFKSRVKRGGGKFCSVECYRKYWMENVLTKIISKRANSVTLKCQYCGKPFKVWKSRLKRYNVKFCSRKCFNQYKREHAKELMGGTKHWNWQGGISEEHHKLRRRKEYQKWRKAVLKRDNYTCRLCGQRGGKLTAHHIYNFCKYPELRYNIDNGITLCASCHARLHIYKDKNALESLEKIICKRLS